MPDKDSPQTSPVSSPQTLDFFEIESSVKKWEGNRFPPDGAEWDACVLCDRPVRTDRPHWRITLTDGGSSLIRPDEVTAGVEADPLFHGSHAIGPGCRKRIPKEFLERHRD